MVRFVQMAQRTGLARFVRSVLDRIPGRVQRVALDKHIENIEDVQATEAILRSRLRGKHAGAPDLWLLTASGHRFIEVKLPGDHLKDTQLAGLALIATQLKMKVTQPVSVEVVTLFANPVVDRRDLSEDERDRFMMFCDVLTPPEAMQRSDCSDA